MPSITSLNDTEHILIADVFSGNKQAFGKLYGKYAAILLGCILKIVADKKLAEDILQKSFITIWNTRHDYNACSECLFIWMLGITKKTAFRFVDIKPQNINGKIRQAITTVNRNGDVNKKGFLCDENELDTLQKTVLELIYFNNYSLKDAAEALNIDEAKLKTMLRCAVNKLKNSPQ